MTRELIPKNIQGIQCYSVESAEVYLDYPASGFDLTDEYAETSFWVRSRNRLFKWLVRREKDRLGTARLLDVGCGTGEFLQHLDNDGSLSLTGSEVYLRGLKLAKARQPHMNFIQYDVTQGILDQSYDIITAFDVFEHIEQDLDGMCHVHEMLTDHGVFIISVPQHMFLWSQLDEIVFHKRRYSRAEMLSKLRQSGFTPVRTTSYVFALFPLMWLSRLFDRAKPQRVQDEDGALADRVKFSPLANWGLNKIMHFDEALIKLGISLPFGGTLVVVSRKNEP